ncbi:glycosyltransferase family 2 protein [Balneolaceae bacterium YR4-1]|uniref:Glycosyltransferase family 2 protein n=1 Tax=Halalkalibaculum roseum TaxID=2709311 RepID=A0A6M1T8A4_9BACT|nr:glycosyltransferase family 2 protein [Halalkalibaculum roseum]NGP76513.1 glycosyltransferase family 2 protein [Halalkalibaculum roseum]
MHRFSIIIVSWNALHHLQEFLPSVAKTHYDNYEIILANNASSDGSVEWVERQFPEVEIATFDKNYGYCGGNNRAVPYANGDILLFLNNDVAVEQDWLQGLNDTFDEDKKIAAVQPKMLSYENPEYFEYAGAAGGYLDKYGYPFCKGRIFDTLETDLGQYDSPSDILWGSGAALAIRKEVFEEMGGFDEDFEFHMEEIDLCWRIWNEGLKVRYCPKSVVYHLGGGSMPMGSPRKVYYNYRNNLRMIWKNASSGTLPYRFPIRYKLDIIAAFRSLFTGNIEEFKAIARAHKDFWKYFHRTQQKRNKLLESRKISTNPETMLSINLIWDYFLRGKRHFNELIDETHGNSHI